MKPASGRELEGVLALDSMPNQATSALHKSELVCETALQKNADAKVSGHIGHCD